MKNHKTRNILLIVGTLITAILAIVVIVISIQLQKRGSTPVAPNVPTSKPKAAIPEQACTTTFTVAPLEGPKAACEAKQAFKNVVGALPAAADLVALTVIPAGSAIYPGTTFIYRLNGVPINSGNAPEVDWTDVLDPRLEFVDASEDCTTLTNLGNGQVTVNCKQGNPHNNRDYNVLIRVKVKADATVGKLTNTGTVLTDNVASGTCALDLTIVSLNTLTCSKQVFFDNKNVASPYANLGNATDYPQIADSATVDANKTIVYSLKLKNPATTAVTGLTVTDVLDPKLTFVDADPNCTHVTSTRTVTCTNVTIAAGGDVLVGASFRAKLPASVTETTTITNTYSVAGATLTSPATCSTSVKIEPPGATPTPTPPPGAGFYILKYNDANGDGLKQDTETGLAWDFEWDLNADNNWRAYVVSDATTGKGGNISGLKVGDKVRIKEKGKDGWSSTTPNSHEITLTTTTLVKVEFGNRQKTAAGCNNSCTANSDCASGLSCSSGTCRNAACNTKTNCICDVTVSGPTPTPAAVAAAPTPAPLPAAGSTAETVGTIAVGIVITVLGIIGLFAL